MVPWVHQSLTSVPPSPQDWHEQRLAHLTAEFCRWQSGRTCSREHAWQHAMIFTPAWSKFSKPIPSYMDKIDIIGSCRNKVLTFGPITPLTLTMKHSFPICQSRFPMFHGKALACQSSLWCAKHQPGRWRDSRSPGRPSMRTSPQVAVTCCYRVDLSWSSRRTWLLSTNFWGFQPVELQQLIRFRAEEAEAPTWPIFIFRAFFFRLLCPGCRCHWPWDGA